MMYYSTEDLVLSDITRNVAVMTYLWNGKGCVVSTY